MSQAFEALVGAHKIVKKTSTNPSELTLELNEIIKKKLASPRLSFRLLLEPTKSPNPFGAHFGTREIIETVHQPFTTRPETHMIINKKKS